MAKYTIVDHTENDDCIISVCLEALEDVVFETAPPTITINGKKFTRARWTLVDIIKAAAFEVDDGAGKGRAYGDWHDHIFLERLSRKGNDFVLDFGS